MATKLSHEVQLPISLAQYRKALVTQSYWSNLAKVTNENSKVNDIQIGSNTVVAATTVHVPPEELQAAIQKAKPRGLDIARGENWTFHEDHLYSDISIRVLDTPALLHGHYLVRPIDDNSVSLKIDGQAEVNIPLFGKKIEQAVIENISAILGIERDYTVSWVKDNLANYA